MIVRIFASSMILLTTANFALRMDDIHGAPDNPAVAVLDTRPISEDRYAVSRFDVFTVSLGDVSALPTTRQMFPEIPESWIQLIKELGVFVGIISALLGVIWNRKSNTTNSKNTSTLATNLGLTQAVQNASPGPQIGPSVLASTIAIATKPREAAEPSIPPEMLTLVGKTCPMYPVCLASGPKTPGCTCEQKR